MPRIIPLPIFQHQADAYLSQTNPVSTTPYTVLDTTKNVRIYGIFTNITWATNQPNPLVVIITIDGQTLIFSVANPVSGTSYYPLFPSLTADEASQSLVTSGSDESYRAFLIEGRSVKIQVRYTGAAGTTNLSCRVKYAKIP